MDLILILSRFFLQHYLKGKLVFLRSLLIQKLLTLFCKTRVQLKAATTVKRRCSYHYFGMMVSTALYNMNFRECHFYKCLQLIDKQRGHDCLPITHCLRYFQKGKFLTELYIAYLLQNSIKNNNVKIIFRYNKKSSESFCAEIIELL